MKIINQINQFVIPTLVSSLVAAAAFATVRLEAVHFQGPKAAKLYESLQVPVTAFSAYDQSYVVFVKEKGNVKCSALAKGAVQNFNQNPSHIPGRKARYGCEVLRRVAHR